MTNVHKPHNDAVELVLKHLSGAINSDSVFGYRKPYDVRWSGFNLRVKIARPSKKVSQNKKRYYYTLDESKRKLIDFYILFALNKSKIEGLFVLPKVLAPRRYITITHADKVLRYERFSTNLIDLASKIYSVDQQLPKLVKMKRQHGK